MAMLLFASFAVMIVSSVMSVKKNKTDNVVNGIHGKRITYAVTAGLLLLLLLTFALGPTGPLVINGEEYSDALWTRTVNMFIISSGVMLLVSVFAVCFGMYQNRRDNRRRKIRLNR